MEYRGKQTLKIIEAFRALYQTVRTAVPDALVACSVAATRARCPPKFSRIRTRAVKTIFFAARLLQFPFVQGKDLSRSWRFEGDHLRDTFPHKTPPVIPKPV